MIDLTTLLHDPRAFAEACARHPRFEAELPGLLARIRADPAVLEALRAHLPAYRRTTLEQWLVRRLLRPVSSIEDFLHLAVEAARERWPDFPHLRPGQLEIWSTGYDHCLRRADTRVDGRGWTARVDSTREGPAEVIDVEDWEVTAHGADGELAICRDAVRGGLDWVWIEVR